MSFCVHKLQKKINKFDVLIAYKIYILISFVRKLNIFLCVYVCERACTCDKNYHTRKIKHKDRETVRYKMQFFIWRTQNIYKEKEAIKTHNKKTEVVTLYRTRK